jgi:hypothetical protein
VNPSTWLDERGQSRPNRLCPHCGREIPVVIVPPELLKSYGWQPWQLATVVEWCGHQIEASRCRLLMGGGDSLWLRERVPDDSVKPGLPRRMVALWAPGPSGIWRDSPSSRAYARRIRSWRS